MAKAFDSVGLTPLNKIMVCIKIPVALKEFIMNLFYKRQIRVITRFSISESFTGKDDIDQEETIFLFLWRIFYNPLLCQIQDNFTLEITIRNAI